MLHSGLLQSEKKDEEELPSPCPWNLGRAPTKECLGPSPAREGLAPPPPASAATKTGVSKTGVAACGETSWERTLEADASRCISSCTRAIMRRCSSRRRIVCILLRAKARCRMRAAASSTSEPQPLVLLPGIARMLAQSADAGVWGVSSSASLPSGSSVLGPRVLLLRMSGLLLLRAAGGEPREPSSGDFADHLSALRFPALLIFQ
mmetsp:Transcript_51946/g.126709  ORF Transcript_51946/g.126709 Transcript_51946/m.126709 type:complete len:206 (+) Transcript_51946:677-1294(+)